MKNQIFGCLLVMSTAVASTRAQDPTEAQSAVQEKAAVQAAPSALTAYTKWREATLPRYAQREATPHYAVAIVA
ncbi:MAG: hypothetical protein ACREPG_07160, partial [Candidatus Binatia bacterium]